MKDFLEDFNKRFSYRLRELKFRIIERDINWSNKTTADIKTFNFKFVFCSDVKWERLEDKIECFVLIFEKVMNEMPNVEKVVCVVNNFQEYRHNVWILLNVNVEFQKERVKEKRGIGKYRFISRSYDKN